MSDDTTGKVITLAPPVYIADIPAALRNLADNLEDEAKAYGPGFVMRVVVVVRVSGDAPRVHGLGDVPPAQAYMDLHAGAQQLMGMQSPTR